jgi:hypothetical protein
MVVKLYAASKISLTEKGKLCSVSPNYVRVAFPQEILRITNYELLTKFTTAAAKASGSTGLAMCI